ncbi:TIGR04282 family arsenosugar biosynthesis glycosyltransferase [Iningainema tapete]|uniref:TIGR04282 family arsenosugar biosynthesis glycosyltransferase n=1 Tax=Iningainema tapete BLCC-T55 TaxID=2748662 RepID=A0A8J7CHG9_9CYAN|nr:TIGR04282 family arsenosugar biosynthesis glycosyltransferase [Iningainema tapete]MBD2777645.1 TIGR04282 family arsenosugar biosynthesis glycosyltransferase [Iningainema tapete BLCC-T55]
MKLPQIAKQHLIIFTRYPEAGKTKTRLIPALGAEGAASLHRQMTEHTLSQVRQLHIDPPHGGFSFEVRYAGGDLQLMQDWLGTDLVYQSQGEGDLGQRMVRSLVAFESGTEQAVIIGSDCPGLNTQILAQAFKHLYLHDLVLGPALDGGYYLIGLRCLIKELFTNIDWGTARVLQQTIDVAQQLNLSVADLPPLADVDRPEDLPIWEKIVNSNSNLV